MTAASTTTFTNKSIAGSEVNSGLVASTVGGTGVNNSVTLTLGTTARNYATLGTGFEYNTTTTGAATDATAAQLGALINIAQYDVLVSGGTAAAVAGAAPGSTSGLPFVSQGASSNPTFAALALTALATQTNATLLSNVSGITAAPSANALPTTANALIKTSNSNGARLPLRFPTAAPVSQLEVRPEERKAQEHSTPPAFTSMAQRWALAARAQAHSTIFPTGRRPPRWVA